jgi:hypothetical protein
MNIITLENDELPISPNYSDIIYECKSLDSIDFMKESLIKFPIYGRINNDNLGLYNVNIKLYNDKRYTIDFDISYDSDIVCRDIELSTIDFSNVMDIVNKVNISGRSEFDKLARSQDLSTVWGNYDSKDEEIIYKVCKNNTLYEIELNPSLLNGPVHHKFYIGRIDDIVLISSKKLLNNYSIYDMISSSVINKIRTDIKRLNND